MRRTMAAAGWLVVVVVVLRALEFAVVHCHSKEMEIYHVSVGSLFLLRCNVAGAHINVTWSRDERQDQSLPTGVEVRDGLLWFLPVQMSHNGSYTCVRRDEPGPKMNFWVSVSSGRCPDAPEHISIPRGVNGGLHCKQKDIFRLNNTRNIRWMKDCLPVEQEVDEDGFMRLLAASESDAGKYTCLVDISLEGRTYTSARSMQLTIKDGITDEIFAEPEVVYPQQAVVVVEVGSRAELKCLAYIGFSEDSNVLTYWTVDSAYPDDYKELNESWKNIHDRGMVYRLSTLSISKVLRQFLNVPFYCHIMSPADKKVGLVRLQEADHSALHTSVALCLAASLTLLALVAVILLFKVELVLVYRNLLGHVKQRLPDGKLYDAYVSFLHHDASAETETFALQILPEELEKQHGYSLYIRGRDDHPGEAVHDAIAATLCQCRRLIIILSPDAKFSTYGKKGAELLCDYQNQFCYEQKLGLHDALTQNGPKVILLEIGGPVDYSCLPESLRYLKRKQGSLKWKKPSNGSNALCKLCSNRRFWKKLRYQMPSVPAGRPQTII